MNIKLEFRPRDLADTQMTGYGYCFISRDSAGLTSYVDERHKGSNLLHLAGFSDEIEYIDFNADEVPWLDPYATLKHIADAPIVVTCDPARGEHYWWTPKDGYTLLVSIDEKPKYHIDVFDENPKLVLVPNFQSSSPSCGKCTRFDRALQYCYETREPVKPSDIPMSCPHYCEKRRTVYDNIIESKLSLAENLVYELDNRFLARWRSTIIPFEDNNGRYGVFWTRQEAINATLVELEKIKEAKQDETQS